MRPRIYIRHVKQAGLCSRGLRLFATEHNLDWVDFLENGIDIDDVKNIDDALVQAVIAAAQKEVERGQ